MLMNCLVYHCSEDKFSKLETFLITLMEIQYNSENTIVKCTRIYNIK